MEHRQRDWPEWLASAEFVVNNKIHIATKVLLFMANYGRELRMEGDIRKKRKVKSVIEFVERMKKVHEEAGIVLRKMQEEMKRYADQNRRDRVMLSTKDLVFRERPACKLTERYVRPYTIEEVISSNVVKL